MSGPLTGKDLFNYEQPEPVKYPKDSLFNFGEYKNQISLLLSHFMEDILSLEEKINAVENIVDKQLKDFTSSDGMPEQLKRALANKIDHLTNNFKDGIISDRSQMIRRESTYASSVKLPADLNIEYLQNYIRDRLSPLMPKIYKAFYKAPAGPHDRELVSYLQKLGKLDEFLGGLSENNILSKINFHYIELVSFMFSNGGRAELARQIPNLVCLDMKQVMENVLEGGGREWMKSNVTSRNTMTSKENTIDKLNALLLDQPRSFVLNLDVIFKLKLLRDKIDMKHELFNHVEKAFNIFNSSAEKRFLMDEYSDQVNFTKDQLLNLNLYLKSLQSLNAAHFASDVMKNTEESVVVSAISGHNTKDLDKIVDSVLRGTQNEGAFTDPAIARIYQEVLRGAFTPETISKCLPTVANAKKFQDFERLAMCVVKMYEIMDRILDDLRNGQRSRQAEIFTRLTEQILNKTADSLNERFYYKTDLGKVMDDMFFEIENLIAVQEALRPDLEDQEKQRSQFHKSAQLEKSMFNRKAIDCGISKLAELTKLGISRLIPKVDYSDRVLFDWINFETNLREMIKRTVQRTDLHNDKYIFFYLNDKRKFKHFDFFKIVLIEVGQNTTAQKSEIVHFEQNPSAEDKRAVMYEQYYLEPSDKSTLKIDPSYDNRIEVQFEDDISIYNIQSKLILAVYQIVFKSFVKDLLPTDYFKQGRSDIPQVIITMENLYEFFSFLKGRTDHALYDESKMRLLESTLTHGVAGQPVNSRYQNDRMQGGDRINVSEVQQELLDVYGNGTSKKYDGSLQNTLGSYPGAGDSQRGFGATTSNIPKSFLQSVIAANQKKLGPGRENLTSYLEASNGAQLAHSTQVSNQDYDRERTEQQNKRKEEELERRRRAEEAQAERERDRLRRQAEERDRREQQAKEAALKQEEERRQREAKRREEDEDRRQREVKMKAERDAKDAIEREQLKARREAEDKAREEERIKREEKEKELREEVARKAKAREEEERVAREARAKEEELRRERVRKEMEEREGEEKARREREQEQREKERREREEREKVERERREQEDRERREEKERREREERERLDKLKKEKEESDRIEREKRAKEDKERAEREESLRIERAAKDKQAEEERKRLEKEREDQERIKREQREEEEQERKRKDREAQEEANRIQREIEKQEEADRIQRERELEEERKKREKEQEEEKIKSQNAKEAQKKKDDDFDDFDDFGDIDDGLDDFGGSIDKKKQPEDKPVKKSDDDFGESIEKAEVPKKESVQANNIEKDEFDDFDDFGDIDDGLDDFGGSTDKKKPETKSPLKPDSAAHEPEKITPAEPPKIRAKGNQPADEEIEFDDDFDDFLNDDLEDSKPKSVKKPAAVVQPPKAPEPEPEQAPPVSTFAGGLKGLKKKSEERQATVPLPTAAAGLQELDNPRGDRKVVKVDDLLVVDDYLQRTSPLTEDQVQDFMGSLALDHGTVSMIFNEFVANQTIFLLDFEETNHILRLWVDSLSKNGQLDDGSINQLGRMIGQLLQGTFEDQPFEKIKYFFAPFMIVGEVGQESLVQAIVDLANKQVFFVSLNPDMTEEVIRNDSSFHAVANILAKSLNIALGKDGNIQIPSENLHAPTMGMELIEFLAESCEAPMPEEGEEDGDNPEQSYPYLRFMMVTYLILYENATDRLNFDGFKKSLSLEAFDLMNAARFVSTMRAASESLKLRTQLEHMPEIAEGLLQTAQVIKQQRNCEIIPKLADNITNPADLNQTVKEDIAELVELSKSHDRVISVLEYMFNEHGTQKVVLFLSIQKLEPNLLMYLSENTEPYNAEAIAVIKKELKGAGGEPEVYLENPRHQFATERIDIFCFTWSILIYEEQMTAIEALRCLMYNEMSFVNELMQGLMTGEEEMNPNDMAIGQEDSNERGIVEDPDGGIAGEDGEFDDFGLDDFDEDLADEKPKAAAQAPPKKASSGKLRSNKPKDSNIDYNFDDDFDLDVDQQAPPKKDGDNAGGDFDDFDDDFDFDE